MSVNGKSLKNSITMADVAMRRRDPLFEKARKLAESNRIEFLGNGVYNVVGDHGTYTVAEDFSGNLSCNCQGFLTKRRCSHALAVQLLAKKKRRVQPR